MSRQQDVRERNWTLAQYVAYLRLLNGKANEAEIDLVLCLIRLEAKTDLWKAWGLETFAQSLNDLKYVGISMSAVRYENVKLAIQDFGEARVRRWGLHAARRARRLHGSDRERFTLRVEEIRRKQQRSLSEQTAFGVYREIAPVPPNTSPGTPASLKIRQLERELKHLSEREARAREQLEIWRAVVERVKSWLVANGVKGFPWTSIWKDARSAVTAKHAKRSAA